MSALGAALGAVAGLVGGPLAHRAIGRWLEEWTGRAWPVAAALVVLSAVTGAVYGPGLRLPALLVFVWSLVVATVIDLAERIIPNRLSLPLAPGLLALLAIPAALEPGGGGALLRGVVAGIGIAGGMLALSELLRLVRGQAGIGMGDVKLTVSIGLVVGYLGGWQLMVFLYVSAISAVVAGLGLMLAGRASLATRIPYGPYLAVGALVAVIGNGPLADLVAGFLLG